MAKEGTWGARLIIIAFATAVVALGIKEVNHKLDTGTKKGVVANPNMVRDLHGSSPIERAQLNSEAVASAKASRSQEPQGDDAPTKSDKNNLQSLIDSVME